MALDRLWALNELRQFLKLTDQVPHKNPPGVGVVILGTYQNGSQEDVSAQAHVVEQILDRVLPDWRRETSAKEKETRSKQRWVALREWAGRAIGALEREEELAERLGDGSPRMSAGGLHPWVWEPAKRLWADGHFRAALHAAGSNLVSQTQAKTGRVDIADKALYEQVLNLAAPAPDKPRLRVAPDDGSSTNRSLQEGSMHLGIGLSMAIRNPSAHSTDELEEQVAFERLAAYSVLARLLDDATIVKI